MGIDVAIVDENHEHGQQIDDPHQYLTQLAMDSWLKLEESICLRFIDPWGDTVFNQAQIPVLLAELEQAHAQETNPDIKAHLDRVFHLVSLAKGQVHTYIKFLGD